MPKDLLQPAAEALAKATPDYAGKSAYPPLLWWSEGEELVVLCADNRKVRGPLPPAVTLKITMQPGSHTPKTAMPLEDPPAKKSEADQPNPPAKHKAGK